MYLGRKVKDKVVIKNLVSNFEILYCSTVPTQ